MIDMQKLKKDKRRILICLCFLSIIYLVAIFWGTLDRGSQSLGLLFLATWVMMFVEHKFLSLKLEMLEEMQGNKGQPEKEDATE